jgi:hypothetical protein
MSPRSAISRLDGNLSYASLHPEFVLDQDLLHAAMTAVISSLFRPPLKATCPQLASLAVYQPSQYGLTARFFPADVLVRLKNSKHRDRSDPCESSHPGWFGSPYAWSLGSQGSDLPRG